jgi:release factor glutamine methyltransferase
MKALLEVLRAGAGYLEKRGVDEARLNMEHLLAHVLECRRLDLYLRHGEMLREPDLERLRDLSRKRGEGVPLQHLLGTVEFGGLELVTDPRALVPRPETDFLCDWLVKRLRPPPPRVLDMACGSGCIGLALARAWRAEGVSVTLADVSEDALDLARLNASRLGFGDLKILRSDLFEKLEGPFDLVTANLPYIPSGEIAGLSREVRRDPLLALDGGPDGLEVVRRFLTEAPPRLGEDGLVALELGAGQADTVAEEMRAAGWRGVETFADLAGVVRFILAKRPAAGE